MEKGAQSYQPDIEDISDDEPAAVGKNDEENCLESFSTFPNGECSRTSPGNHATVRRWRQRSSKYSDDGNKIQHLDSSRSDSDGAQQTSPLSLMKSAIENVSSPAFDAHARNSSALLCTTTTPSPTKERPKMPFQISSLMEEDKGKKIVSLPTTTDRQDKSSSAGAIPIGIAVGRQRETKQVARPENINILAPQPISAHLPAPPPLIHTPSAVPPPLSQNMDLSSLHPPSPFSNFPVLHQTSHAPYPYAPLPFPAHPPNPSQWTNGLEHLSQYGYPSLPPPDPAYYLYLQQQLLFLHHQHMQVLRHSSPSAMAPLNLHQEVKRDAQASSLEDPKTNNKGIIHDDLFVDIVKEDQRHEIDSRKIADEAPSKTNTQENRQPKNSFQELEENFPRSFTHFPEEDKISVGDEQDAYDNAALIEEKLDVVSGLSDDEARTTHDDNPFQTTSNQEEELNENRGLYLLAESIEHMENGKAEQQQQQACSIRKARYASTDCCQQTTDSLQILCDVAHLRQSDDFKAKEIISRVERSKSLDSYRSNIDRNHNSLTAKNDIKDFISKKLMKHKKQDDFEDLTKEQTVDDMDAWEIELRIQMADKQRKYNEINKKLLKIQKIKIRSPKRRLHKLKHKKSKSRKDIICKQKPFEDKAIKQSNFEETFYKFKKAYLASHKSDDRNEECLQKEIQNKKVMFNDTIKMDIIKEETVTFTKASTLSEQNHNNIIKSYTAEKETHQYKKPKHEKFVVAKHFHQDKKITSGEQSLSDINDIEFSQYKHKKIRRRSMDVKGTAEIIYTSNEDKGSKIVAISEEKLQIETLNIKAKIEKCKVIPETETSNVLELDNQKKKKKRRKDKKKKKEKEREKEDKHKKHKLITSNVESNETPAPKPQMAEDKKCVRSCTLKPEDLIDGLRILKRIGCHFYPGRLTEISPPDIYGIVVDRERGNKPHIFSQEEVLNEAVLEIKPKAVTELNNGLRVCAFWSNQMNYLHPGTVAGPDVDKNYVIIQLDDGDSRDIHIDQVRYLPEDYPFVAEESVTGLFGSRKRGATSHNPAKEEKKSKTSKDEDKPKHSKHKSRKKKHRECQWSVSVKEVSDNEGDAEKGKEEGADLKSMEEKQGRDDDQDSAFASPSQSDMEENEDQTTPIRRVSGNDKSAIAAFLPPQQLLWAWSDKGYKLSAKARKVFHNSIEKDDESMKVGDCAVFLSTGRPDRPYIGRIDSMWETSAGGMRVKVKWFYHQAEVEGTAVGGGRVEDIKTEGALFSSSHYDENDVQTISHKCQLLDYAEFLKVTEDKSVEATDSEDIYYLAGEYDPVEGTIVFAPGILDQTDKKDTM